MIDNIKKFLNEEQDPKAIEKITSKLNDLLMKNEEIGYIAVQKKPAITVFPDSIVVTNKRIIICQPKNMGLSMNFTDFTWDEIESTFMKENILGSEFSFSSKTQIQVSIDYIPKTQARKISTYAKEQLDLLKNPIATEEVKPQIPEFIQEEIEQVEAAPEKQFYQVKAGDSLSKISKEVYGNANHYAAIFEANKPMLTDMDKIYPGQTLVIPELA